MSTTTTTKGDCVVGESVPATVNALVEHILTALTALSPNRPDHITIGLSGGSFVKQFSAALNDSPDYVKRFAPFTSRLRFLFCDERFVPLDHADSTFHGFESSGLFKTLGVSVETQVLAIKDDAADVNACAVDYEARLTPLLNTNKGFDILLLGIGPDGHTCSLFPGHPLFTEAAKQTNLVLPINDSPKPPPQRVTLTLSPINRSDYLFFCAVGAGKAEMMKRIHVTKDLSIPSANVRPTNAHGKLAWFIDAPAATQL